MAEAHPQEIKDRARDIDPECWASYSGREKHFKRAMDHRRSASLDQAHRELDHALADQRRRDMERDTTTAAEIAAAIDNAWLENAREITNVGGVTVELIQAKLRWLDAEVERLRAEVAARTLSKLDRESLQLGREIQRAASELPRGWYITIDVENGAGSVCVYDPEHEGQGFNDHVDGMSWSVKSAIEHAKAQDGA